MVRGTLICLAFLTIIIALMYHFQPGVVHSFMSFGEGIDKIIVRVNASLATGFAIAVLALELVKNGKERGGK